MASITTQTRKRLKRLRLRRSREQKKPTVIRDSTPFRYDASLRIAGLGDIQDSITPLTGVVPSHIHRKGDSLGRGGRRRQEDMWLLASPLGEDASLYEHLRWLWHQVEPCMEQFRMYIQKAAWADICLGYFSESVYPVLTVSPEALRILRELEVGVAFNFTVV